MILSRLLSTKRQPVSKWTVILTALLLTNTVNDLARTSRQSEPWQFAFIVSFVVAFAFLWPLLAIARCVDLRISPYFVAPIAALYLAAIAAVIENHDTAAWAVGAIALFAQVPFVFLSPRQRTTGGEKQ